AVVEEAVAAPEAVIEEIVAAPEAVVEEVVAAPEAVVEEVVAAPEAVVEEAVATPEAVVEEAVATREAVVEEAVAAPEAVVEEAVTAPEAVVEEAVAAPEAVIEEAVAAPEAVVEEAVATREVIIEEAVATPEAVVEEAVAAPEAVVEEAVTAPEAVVEEAVAAPEAVVEEAVATPEAVVEEVVATPEAVVEEAVAAPEAVVEEVVAAPEAVVEEAVAAPEAVVEEAVATREAVVEEAVATREVIIEEAVAAPEAVVEEAVAAPEAVVEEAVAAPEAVVEEVVAAPEAVVEEVVATPEAVVEEAVATREVIIEEAVAAPEAVVEEAVAAPEAVVEEAVAAPEAVIEDSTDVVSESTVDVPHVRSLSLSADDKAGESTADFVGDRKPAADSVPHGTNSAELAAGVSLALAAVGASLASRLFLSDTSFTGADSTDQSADVARSLTVEQVSEPAVNHTDSDPEVIEMPDGTGSLSTSPYEVVELFESFTPAAVPADEFTPESTIPATAHSVVAASVVSVSSDITSLSGLETADAHTAPVVVGTIEAVEPETVSRALPAPKVAEQAHIEPVVMTKPVAESGITLPESVDSSQAAHEAASWNSPRSQISYNRADSQLSHSGDQTTSAPAEDAAGNVISNRDSAIFMDKPFADAKTTDISSAQDSNGPVKVEQTFLQDQAVAEANRLTGLEAKEEAKEEAQTPYSTFSTPAFPEYFRHPEVHQQGNEVVSRREIPRASDGGARKPVFGRPKDVLMELNIETPYDGRQLLQLRAADNLDDLCEEFCEHYNMLELLPGMRTLVRGKVERRLARRRERALQAAAASQGK
ncbi:hypothetical protein LPJ66_007058, partial [Kickxella alabastrina]